MVEQFEVAIPLEQGRFFNMTQLANTSAWTVAIPLEQGRFFNSEVCFSFLFLGY